MTHQPDWDLDKLEGDEAEELVSRARTSILAGTIEVKYDRKACETGNVYIEYECRWRDGTWHPSGIARTKAEAWAFVIGHTMVLVATDDLKQVAREHFGTGHRELTRGSHPTKGVVVPLEQLVKRTIALANQQVLEVAA